SYVNKQQAPGTIVGAIRATAAGKRYLSKELADRLRELVLHRRSGGWAGARELSPRELEVFELIGNGKSTRDIAQQLGLSVHTIETHREKLRAKLLLRNGRELTQAAVRWVLENRSARQALPRTGAYAYAHLTAPTVNPAMKRSRNRL